MTLGSAWITVYWGKRYICISGELNVGHGEKLLGWSNVKFCQRISWKSKSKSLCEMNTKGIMNRDDPREAGQSQESTNMPIRKKGSFSEPGGSEIMKLPYTSVHHQPKKKSLLVYPFISAPGTCLDPRCLKYQLEVRKKVNRERKSRSSTTNSFQHSSLGQL